MEKLVFAALPYASAFTAVLAVVLWIIIRKIRRVKKLYNSLSMNDDPLYERRKKLFLAYDNLCILAVAALFLWMIAMLVLSAGFEQYIGYIIAAMCVFAIGIYRLIRH